MKILLPPSETKRPGGDARPLDLDALALPGLREQRDAVLAALAALSHDEDRARRVLKLSERQLGDLEHNRTLRSAPTMAAVDRYTGVLYDALDAPSLDANARAHLQERFLIHSAPFGPVAALDPIPVYRLAAGVALPGVAPLRRHWADAVTAALGEDGAAFVLDLRSEAYVALGPIPASIPSAYVRVVTESGRALNHFNKKAKGQFARAFAQTGRAVRTPEELIAWADDAGIVLRKTQDETLWELVTTV